MYEDLTVREYKKCVASWANACDAAYRSLLWVLGSRANKDGYEWFNSYEDIQRDIRIYRARQGDEDPWVPSIRTLKRYVSTLREAGVLVSQQTSYQRHGKTLWGANVYAPNFDVILVDGRVQEHNFLAPLLPEEVVVDTVWHADGPRMAPGCPPDGPQYKSLTYVSSMQSLEIGPQNRAQARVRGGDPSGGGPDG